MFFSPGIYDPEKIAFGPDGSVGYTVYMIVYDILYHILSCTILKMSTWTKNQFYSRLCRKSKIFLLVPQINFFYKLIFFFHLFYIYFNNYEVSFIYL